MNERHPNAAVWLAVIGILLALPVLYVVSIGPAAAYYENDDPPEMVLAFYAPLTWVSEASPPIEVALERYIDLWVDYDM